MKKIIPALFIAVLLYACNPGSEMVKFSVTGELKGAPDQKIYLEELFFNGKQAAVLDTGQIKNGLFRVSTVAAEQGLYRLRNEAGDENFIFINDGTDILFSAVTGNPEISNQQFSGSANSSFKKLMLYADSLGSLISGKYRLLNEFTKLGVLPTDSIFGVVSDEYKQLTETLSAYCFKYADSAQSPILSLYAATMAPVEMSKFEIPVTNLTKRFPKHNGIASALAFIKTQIIAQSRPAQTQPKPGTGVSLGNVAPELTMNDVNDKPFSLSQLRGKYVLIDFWASWCAPCRDENPNVVAAYNQFKDKNFTVLGVSLDKNKEAWIAAIKEDKLNWHQISDLQYWNSAAIPLYRFDGIPYNVLIDPQGKIIAADLRGSALQRKLAELLP